eukprot:6912332-Heterocapsa_arctica.AAC.1
MVKDPNAAAAFVDAVQAWAESDYVQDAWQRAVEEHDIHQLWTLVSGGLRRLGMASYKRTLAPTTYKVSLCTRELRER